MKTNKGKSPSYAWMVILIFIIALLTGIIIWQFLFLQSKYLQGQTDISKIKNSLSVFEKYAREDMLTEEGSAKFQVDLIYPALSSDKADNLDETIAIVQNANSHALSTINNYLVIFSILITVVVLIVPIFNYWFLQKDQIKRLDEQYNSYCDQFNNELNRMRKSIRQSVQVSFAAISGATKDEAHIVFNSIEPISDSPKDKATAHYINSDIYILRKQPTCALREITKAIELDPNNAELYNERGVILHILDRYLESLRDKNKAIDLDPLNASYIDCRGITLFMLDRKEDALKDHSKAIELDPCNSRYHYNRGVLYFEKEQYQDSLSDIDNAIELEPDNVEYINFRKFVQDKIDQNK